MNGLWDIASDAGSIDLADPVDWDAWRELIGPPPLLWLKALPQFMGSRWYNLARHRVRNVPHATLTNGAVFSGARKTFHGQFAFCSYDGSNDYAQIGTPPVFDWGSGNFTIRAMCFSINSGNHKSMFARDKDGNPSYSLGDRKSVV